MRGHLSLARALGLVLAIIAVTACGGQSPASTPTAQASRTPRPTFTPAEQVEGEVLPTQTAGTSSTTTLEAATEATANPGPAFTPTPKPLRMNSPEYGMQAFLWWRPEVASRDVQIIADAGFG